jgi:LysM repeat protein
MNRASHAALFLAALLTMTSVLGAQENTANRAAAIADRDAAEERYKRLSSALDDLMASRNSDQQRFSALEESVRTLRADASRNDAAGKYATREELAKLAESVKEIDRKREADKRLILDEFEELKKELRRLLATPAAPSGRKPAETTPPKPKTSTPSLPATQEGVEHIIAQGETLSAIVAAYNESFKAQGKKTSLKLIQDANEGLKPTSMKVGQKVFIPLVAIQ